MKFRMNLFNLSILVACASFGGAIPPTYGATPTVAVASSLSPETHQELSRARGATARYHDIAQAEADGYINIGLYLPNEGLHYVNFSLIDNTFDLEHPEVLLYAPVDDESELQLVGVEYLVPLAPQPPDGFAGTDDHWRSDAEGFGLWELTVWLWYPNPEGIFADDNQRVP